MQRQTLTVSFNYDSKLIKPLNVLVGELRGELMKCEQINNAYDIKDTISLDYKKVYIEISCVSCDESFKAIQPILKASDIKAKGNINLKYGKEKFIDVLFILGADHKEMDKETIQISAEFLREQLPAKHGFLLIAYSKNGKNLEILTEQGEPTPQEMMEVYGIVLSNMMQ